MRGQAARERVLRGTQWALAFAAAWIWRRLLVRTTFVAITGSVGKTTTRRLLAHVLASRDPTLQSAHNQNDAYGVPRSVLRVRPWHRWAVIEVGAGPGGMLRRSARLVRPHVAVVVSVAHAHSDLFPRLEDTAAEKVKLVRALRRRGTAILHADDPHVAPMAAQAPGRVVRFGLAAPDLDVRGRDPAARWPDRLHLRIEEDGVAHEVRTQLVGAHWTPSVLAAWTAARHLGVPAPEVVAALARVEPSPARMQPVALPSGATLIRDESNGNLATTMRALEVLREARTERRWLVIGDVSHTGSLRTAKRMRRLGETAAALVDGAIFVGPHAHRAARAAVRAGMDPSRVHHAADLREAADLLGRLLGPGDLALLKGRTTDHLSRLALAQEAPVTCWKTYCAKRSLCDTCPELRRGARPELRRTAGTPAG